MPAYHSRDHVTSRLRLRGHDYASASSYFVTLCTEHRICLFGDVRGGVVDLSPAGAMVESWWHYMPARFASVTVDATVVMPNHMHTIVHIGSDPELETTPSLSDVVRWFKIRTTYDYTLGVKTENWPRFPGRLWQTRFYEHIVRTERDLDRIRAYIEVNPARWDEDEYNQRE